MSQVNFENRETKIITGIALVCVKAVAVFYLVLVMFPNIPIFVDKLTGEINAPVLYLLQIVLSLALLALTLKDWRQYLSLRYLHWVLALGVLYVWTLLRLIYFLEDSTEADISHAIDRLERFLLVPAFIVVMVNHSGKTIEKMFFLAIFLVPIPIILGFFFPDFFDSSVKTRAAGTFLNANQASEAALLWFLVVNQRLHKALVLPIFILVGVAVILTFSRSGMIGWVITGACLIFLKQLPRLLLALPVAVILFYSTILLTTEQWLENYIDSENQVTHLLERLDVFGKLGSGSVEEIEDGSRKQREEIAGQTLEEIWKKPVLGHGYEVERNLEVNAHNMPLQIWYTFGLPGLLLYLWLVMLLFDAGRREGYGNFSPFLILFLWFSFFDHAHITDNYWLIIYAFLFRRLSKKSLNPEFGVRGGSRKSRRKSSRKKGRRSRRRSSSGGLTVNDLARDLKRKSEKGDDSVNSEKGYKVRRKRRTRSSPHRDSKRKE